MGGLVNIATNVSPDGRLELVATSRAGSGNTVWHASETSPGGNSWTGWQPLGAPGHGDPGVPALIQHSFDGRLEVFVTTAGDQGVWHAWQTPPPVDAGSEGPHDGFPVFGWSDWAPLGKPGGKIGQSVALTQLSVPDNASMALVAAGGKIWQARQQQPGHGPGPHWSEWSSPSRPGGVAALAVAMASNADGRVEVVTLAESAATGTAPTGGVGRLWHRTLTPPDKWSSWEPFSPPNRGVNEPVVVQNDNGDVEVFTIDDGTIRHRTLRAFSPPGPAEGWAPVGEHRHDFRQVTAFLNARGQMALAATTHGNDLWNTAGTTEGPGTWEPWTPLATVPSASPPAQSGTLQCPRMRFGHSGRLHLFVVNRKTEGLYQVTAATAESWQPVLGRPWSHP
jgi:hypothetical protein